MDKEKTMNTIEHTLIYYTCSCCRESYRDLEDANRCCTGVYLSKHEQEAIWERRLDLNHSSIAICQHH